MADAVVIFRGTEPELFIMSTIRGHSARRLCVALSSEVRERKISFGATDEFENVNIQFGSL